MSRTVQVTQALLQEQSGQDTIEYALIAALIALAAVSAMSSLAGAIASRYSTISDAVSNSL